MLIQHLCNSHSLGYSILTDTISQSFDLQSGLAAMHSHIKGSPVWYYDQSSKSLWDFILIFCEQEFEKAFIATRIQQ